MGTEKHPKRRVTGKRPSRCTREFTNEECESLVVTVIEDKAMKIMQNRKPEDRYTQRFKVDQKSSEDTIQNHQLIQLSTAKRDSGESIFNFWNELAKTCDQI